MWQKRVENKQLSKKDLEKEIASAKLENSYIGIMG